MFADNFVGIKLIILFILRALNMIRNLKLNNHNNHNKRIINDTKRYTESALKYEVYKKICGYGTQVVRL